MPPVAISLAMRSALHAHTSRSKHGVHICVFGVIRHITLALSDMQASLLVCLHL